MSRLSDIASRRFAVLNVASRRFAALSVASYVSVALFVAAAQAEDKELDQSIGSIHKIDMTTDDKPKGPSHIVVMMDLKRLKVPGAHGHAIARQFSKRSRIDFDGSGLPKGKYSLAVSGSCKSGSMDAGTYKSAVTELHAFSVTSAHVATEKSLPKASLREPGKGNLVLEGKSLMLFHNVKNKFEVIDCKTISG